MPVHVVQLNEVFPDGKRRYAYIDSHHPTLAALAADLRGGPVGVERLYVKPHGDEMVVTRREQYLLTAAAVYGAFEPDRPFVEYEDAPAEGGQANG